MPSVLGLYRWLSKTADSRPWAELDCVEVPSEVEVDFLHRYDLAIATPAAPPLIPNTGPSWACGGTAGLVLEVEGVG